MLATGCPRGHDAAAPVLRVGTSGDYAPFSGPDGNGLDVEVARRFAADTGRRLELVRFRWPDLTQDLAAGRFDVAMGGITMRPERAFAGTFTRPVVTTGAVVLATAATASHLDAIGLRLGVNAGGHLERVARTRFPRANVVTAADNGLVPTLLDGGTVEAVLTDDVEATAWQAWMPYTVRVGPLTHDRKAYLARDPALAAELDAWLRAREADGSLAALRARWLGPTQAHPRTAAASDLDALCAAIDLRLALMPAVAQAKAAAGRPIEDPAQEARVVAGVRAAAVPDRLDPDAAERLFVAQIAAARAVQASAPPSTDAPVDLDGVLRPSIAAVSAIVLARAADVAADGDPPRAEALTDCVDPDLVPADDRRRIAQAIVTLAPLP